MGKVIAFANQKGGCGKSTSVHNVGRALSEKGQKVLMLDLDPQATLTLFCGFADSRSPTIAQALEKSSTDIMETVQSVSENLDLAPSSEELAQIEFEMPRRRLPDLILKNTIKKVRNNYDFILIDCPPHLGLLTINALAASDSVIIPCSTDYAPFTGLQKLNALVDEIREEVNPDLMLDGVIATLFDMRAKDDNEVLDVLRERFDLLGTVKRLQAAKCCVYEGKSAVEVSPYSDVSLAYKDIAEKLIIGKMED